MTEEKIPTVEEDLKRARFLVFKFFLGGPENFTVSDLYDLKRSLTGLSFLSE